MSGIILFLIFTFAIGVAIILVSVHAYNKHLDKVAKGEISDAHTRLPEPRATAGITYLIIITVLSVFTVTGISAANGRIQSINNSINELKRELSSVNRELLNLQAQAEKSNKLVSDYFWEIVDQDLTDKTATLKFSVGLKQYSDDTTVSLSLGNQTIPLKRTASGSFSGQLTTGLFDFYELLTVQITEGTLTTIETEDFYQNLFWDLLPMPHQECTLTAKYAWGKQTCSGSYRLACNSPEKIKQVTLTYFSGGKELDSFDATKEAKENLPITVKKTLPTNGDLAIRALILTTDGYQIDQMIYLVIPSSPDFHEDSYERIYDAGGNLVWENEKYADIF